VAMAEDGNIPRLFTRKLANGAPWVSILVCGVTWITVLVIMKANFDRLLMLDILLYGASLILEFVALVVLRIREPRLVRPFKVGGGVPIAIFLGIGPTLLLIVAFIKNRKEQLGSISALNLGLILMGAGVVVYFISYFVATSRRKADAKKVSAG
jgi:amino acid transporter